MDNTTHLTVSEAAERYRVCPRTIRRRFSNHPKVMDIGTSPETTRRKRRYQQLRIPISLLESTFKNKRASE